jgi:antitoxin (DNA-binding transcriptional repressor) of toxin-antitoxin stability system
MEVVSLAARGVEVIVMDGNTPRARLIPFSAQQARVPGLHAGAFTVAPDFDAPLPDDFWLGTP